MFSSIWNRMKGRRTGKAPRPAPLCQGHEETKRLTATNATVDLERLLRAIRRAGGAAITVSNAGQQANGNSSLQPTSNQQVSSTTTQPQAPSGGQSAATFPRFTELATELRDLIWENALDEPRLIYIHLGVPGTGAVATFDRFIMNHDHLAEIRSPHSILLDACNDSRNRVLDLEEMEENYRRTWLGRLGLTQYHPTRADLVYMGGLRDGGQAPPADTNRIIPLSLVLGRVLPRVIVNADVFVDYFATNPSGQPENPIAKALADLQTLGNQYAPFFANDPNGLPGPVLPESMVFMLGNSQLKWDIASPCRVPAHTPAFMVSCCIHHDHLEIITNSDMDGWMDENLVNYSTRRRFRIRMEIVPAIRAIFAGWRGQPGAVTRVPQLFFARIMPSA